MKARLILSENLRDLRYELFDISEMEMEILLMALRRCNDGGRNYKEILDCCERAASSEFPYNV
jgi:hypothetical protein